MGRRTSFFLFLAACGPLDGAPREPRTVPANDAPFLDAAPAALDAERARLLCGGECPAWDDLMRPPDLSLALTRREHRVRFWSDGSLAIDRGSNRIVDRVDARDVRALADKFDRSGFAFDERGRAYTSPCIQDRSSRFLGTSIEHRRPPDSMTLVRGTHTLTIVRPACDKKPFSLADEADALARTASRFPR